MKTYIIHCESMQRAKEYMYEILESKELPITTVDNVNICLTLEDRNKLEFRDGDSNVTGGKNNFVINEEEFSQLLKKYREGLN